jgi:hypothetical protein
MGILDCRGIGDFPGYRDCRVIPGMVIPGMVIPERGIPERVISEI